MIRLKLLHCRIRTYGRELTLGLSEVLMGASSGISAALKNKKIESMINEIAKCIDDLRHSY